MAVIPAADVNATRSWSLRARLIGLCLAVIVPMAALEGWSLRAALETDAQRAREQVRQLAQATASETANFLGYASSAAQGLARRDAVRALDPSRCDPLAEDFLGLSPQFTNVVTMDLDGIVVCSVAPLSEARSRRIDPRLYLERLRQTGQVTIGAPIRGVITGKWVVTVAHPLRDSRGVLAGAIGLPIDLQKLQPLPSVGDDSRGLVAWLVDRDGTMLAHSLEPERFVGTRQADQPKIRKMLEERIFGAEVTGPDGIARIQAFAPVPGTEWIAGASLPADAVYAHAGARATMSGLIALAILFVTLLLALWWARAIRDPVAALAQAAERVGAGEISVRAAVAGPAEIAAVATQFNRMLDARGHAERAIRESEERFRQFADNIRDVLWMTNASMSQVLFVSRAYEDTWQRTRDSLYAEPRSWVDAIHPEDRERVVRAAVPGGPAWTYDEEYRIVRPDGTLRWIHDRAFPVRDASGAMSRIAGIAEDVTERVRARMELARREADLRAIFDSVADGIFMADRHGRYLDVNSHGCRMLGYTREEILDRRIADLVVEEERTRAAALVEDPPAGEVTSGEWWFRRKDGTRLLGEVRATVLPDGRHVGIVRDVSEARRAAQQLRLLALAVRQSPAATLITDTEGRIQYVNPKFTAASGYAAEELIGKTPRVVKSGLTPPQVYQDLWKTIKSGVAWRGVMRNRRKNGEIYWEDSLVSPLVDEAGEIINFIAVKEDVTERMQAQEEVMRLNAELEQRVRDRTRELQASNRELEAFAHSVSHDLRAPLVRMKAFADALLEEGASRLDETDRRHVERIRGGTRRMETLIDDLLALSHISRGELVVREVDLSGLVHEILAELREAQPQRRCELSVQAGMRALGDVNLLRIALTNLLANAWKFSAKRDAVVIEVAQAASTQGQATFFVRDRGAGFDPAYSEKLFVAFHRLHGESEFPGTGIGLAIVRRAIERHGGTVRAEGAVGEGATFWFSLPSGRA